MDRGVCGMDMKNFCPPQAIPMNFGDFCKKKNLDWRSGGLEAACRQYEEYCERMSRKWVDSLTLP